MKSAAVAILGFGAFALSVGCNYRSYNAYNKANSEVMDAARDGVDAMGAMDVRDVMTSDGSPDKPDSADAGGNRSPNGAVAQGGVCKSGTECVTGACVDGVCCENACSGQCEACNEPNAAGKCQPVTGAPRPGRTACIGTDMCKGQCDGIDPGRCQYPGSDRSCAAGSCANGSVTTATACTGTGSCSAPSTASCPSNLCADTVKCAGGCDATHPCAATQYCDAASGACLSQKKNGDACTNKAECTSQNCVDGVCCESACAGQCQACGETGKAGQCVTVTGPPRPGRMACAGTVDACRGSCNGTLATACTYPGSTGICVAASCASGNLTAPSVCNGTGGCTTPAITTCRSNQCASTSLCLDSCSATSPCGAGTYCDATGICQPKKANAAVCGAAAECTIGNCVDGVCCDGTCTGQCESCNEPGLAGKCSPVAGNPRGTRTACTGRAPCKGTCGGTDGSKCKFPAAETQCAAGTCTAGSATSPTVCNAAGACTTATAMQCPSNLCTGTICSGGCSATSPCATTQFCNASGICVAKKAQAATCQTAAECTTGFCVDGVCCDVACAGQCEACAETGKVGTCSAVSAAPRGARTACMGTTCRGACDGTLRTACAYPGSAVVCVPASCASAMGTTVSVCNGSGGCTNSTTTACRANQCLNNTTCLTTCSATQPCTGVAFCDANGVCQPKKAQGATCGQTAECNVGSCVDGVCCESACTGPCLSCALTATLGLCRPIVSRDDTNLVACPGTCDAGGLCKSKRAQSCTTTAGGCVAGTFCADGFCCDRACTGSCEICSTTPGTCSFLQGAPHAGRTCPGTTPCTGSCSGSAAACTSFPTTNCRAASCANGTGTMAANCDGAGNCPGLVTMPCGSTQCLNTTTCLNACSATAPCPGTTTFCNTAGVCQAKKALSAACTTTAECASGFCADNVCCSRACNGACESCAVTPGTCTFLAGAPHAGRTCPGTAPCTATCSGSAAACNLFPTGNCRAAACASNTGTLAANCDGAGNCPLLTTVPCVPFTCGPNACKTTCAVDSDCQANNFCYLPNHTCHAAVNKVVAGFDHTCALLRDTRVVCWGDNVFHELGNGNLSITESTTPVVVPVPSNVTDITAGQTHTCVRTTLGTVTCWGNNQLGQLGIGTETLPNPLGLTQVLTSNGAVLSGITSVVGGGNTTCATGNLGTTFCWGDNTSNWLGATPNVTPLDFATSTGVISSGGLSLGFGLVGWGLSNNGALACPWGYNDAAQISATNLFTVLPNALSQCQSTPAGTIIEMSAGGSTACVRAVGGSVWCWGSNNLGQVGIGSSDTMIPPPATVAATNISAVRISVSGVHVCAILAGNTSIACWGFNASGELGNGVIGPQSASPVNVGLTLPAGLTISSLSIGGASAHMCAVLSNGSVMCWGTNQAGEIGNGSVNPNGVPTPTQVVANW